MIANQLLGSDLKRIVAEVICIEELSKMLVKAIHDGDSKKADRFIEDIQKSHNELKRLKENKRKFSDTRQKINQSQSPTELIEKLERMF
ncbi:hypothetical protein [Bacillus sonorensis]|uniref:Uncharacterized protein n=1 Tax=Bacillus sonorensis TaxID=119858 RepID=A0ABM6LGJ2_9BACI|nr:hypothetical protein [Bacillus sonorensis]ASB88392.1 hypothetical protein S101395_01884 [Bacillus sonorensis]RHJ05876.1 hypothetical protein DW143_21250 [Bacillus sonorensis]GIN67636.1 hypothetical protein J41TS2_30570 [Bacillus sonorensis]